VANITKSKGDHSLRMNWGGQFPHLVEDIDVFNRMSSQRQSELRAAHELVANNPQATAILIFNPQTRQPYPGQILYSDIEKKLKESRRSLPEVPPGYKFTLPDGAPRGVLSYAYAPEPTEDEAFQILLAFEKHVTRERLVEFCTYDKRLLYDKPVDGVFAFIWRLARYMSGADTCIPSTAFVDLVDGTSRLTHLRVDLARVKTIMKFLQARAEELVDAVGEDRHRGALRWAQASGVTK
jgi:hypothetical protein